MSKQIKKNVVPKLLKFSDLEATTERVHMFHRE